MSVDQETLKTLIKQSLRKYSNRYWYYIGEDLRQDVELAVFLGNDPIDVIKRSWKYWTFSSRRHARCKFEKPVIVEWRQDDRTDSVTPEMIVGEQEFVQKLFQMVGDKARATIVANLTGTPYVWRPEVKKELQAAARELLT